MTGDHDEGSGRVDVAIEMPGGRWTAVEEQQYQVVVRLSRAYLAGSLVGAAMGIWLAVMFGVSALGPIGDGGKAVAMLAALGAAGMALRAVAKGRFSRRAPLFVITDGDEAAHDSGARVIRSADVRHVKVVNHKPMDINDHSLWQLVVEFRSGDPGILLYQHSFRFKVERLARRLGMRWGVPVIIDGGG